ncbi:hypothetical protein [Parerythrobacter jejuensis]|uniref:Uncharacterized protein n=1 Tax=Parerythrobacter jejuensis TaxID=795812 RepID=A0A845ARV1_9SPHN|nr:hypothetical protein [Parerythrobacter jejuensis]MXP31236.1 hypothetical protein [Parerythrobacter jejuensis]MXP33996.1 hypothetical protein [Parerythrobacter jejuensis]
MKFEHFGLGATALALTMHLPVVAQDAEPAPREETTTIEAAAESAAATMEAAVEQSAPTSPFANRTEGSCELHIWPTENYLGVKMGLLSGFGIVGALADQAANKDKVTTVKDLMRDYLGPEVQLTELEKLGLHDRLGLSDDYRVVIHDPTPWNEDLKGNPELKAQVKATNKKIKRGERLTDSTNPCYAELITTHIFYHKAMMYGSNLFTGWVFREADGDTIVNKGRGQVKNPLEEFPPKDESMIEAAKLELRDAYSKDFAEYVEKKVKK